MAKKTNSPLKAVNDKFLSKILADSGNPYASIIEDNEEKLEYFDTGSYTLNLAMSGYTRKGHPNNFVTVFPGESSTGKTFFILGIIREFLNKYKDGIVFVFESENAPSWLKENLKNLNLDTKRIVKYPVITVSEVTSQALKIVSSYLEIEESLRPPAMMVLDSLGQLSTDKELSDAEDSSGKRDMTRAPEVKRFFRTMCQRLGRAKIPMFVTNHVYEVIGSYVPTKAQGGGKGPIYTASTILSLSKKKDKDESTKSVIGSIITVKIEKGRLTKENMSVQTKISYTKGLDRYFGLLDLCIEYGVVKQNGKKYEFPNGESAFRKTIEENPEKYFTEEMLDIIDDKVGKHFRYGGNEEDECVISDIVVNEGENDE
jgi:RecA/RadA recombinase